MSNFSPKLNEATEDQLLYMINELAPDFSAPSNELLRRAITNLENTIKTSNEETSRQTEKLAKLTWATVWLTVAMFVGLLVQIFLSLDTSANC